MKNAGFKPHYAAAIEAVASNGGQFAPPVMGATAFLIAEFLQISYTNVVVAAAVPAVLYYVCLFSQVDAIALRDGLHGLPREALPSGRAELRKGWVFLLPLGLLLYLLFWRGFNPAVAALWAVAALLVLSIVRNGRLPPREAWLDLLVGGGANMLPLLMIAGGAGVVIGNHECDRSGVFSLPGAHSDRGECRHAGHAHADRRHRHHPGDGHAHGRHLRRAVGDPRARHR